MELVENVFWDRKKTQVMGMFMILNLTEGFVCNIPNNIQGYS
jgi:hypothetical protein